MAKHKWIFGQPVGTDNTNYEWTLGTPYVLHDARVYEISGTAGAASSVTGTILTSDIVAPGGLLAERNWLREALFNGMTANAFKLGTALSLGWLWVRVAGCSVLYRGPGMNRIDFASILTVAEQDARFILPPSYLGHDSNSTHFYVVRRFNKCGSQEKTLAGAVRVRIDTNGDPAEPQPNKISGSKGRQVNSDRIQLVWFYCPLEQQSKPTCFNIYYDNGSGQIDYDNPVATISYQGQKYYSYQSNVLNAGKYLFAVRAEDTDGIEDASLAQLRIQLQTTSPDAIEILDAEAL